MWYWILALASGFGIQVGLYTYIKQSIQKKMGQSTKMEVAATGGVSTISMVACCAHHLVELLPILGLSGVNVFLIKYQISFILVGVCSSLIGILSMLRMIQKHKLYSKESYFSHLFQYDTNKIRYAVTIISVILIALSFMRAKF